MKPLHTPQTSLRVLYSWHSETLTGRFIPGELPSGLETREDNGDFFYQKGHIEAQDIK